MKYILLLLFMGCSSTYYKITCTKDEYHVLTKKMLMEQMSTNDGFECNKNGVKLQRIYDKKLIQFLENLKGLQ